MKKLLVLLVCCLLPFTCFALDWVGVNHYDGFEYTETVTDRVLCPDCIKEGKRSKVHILYSSVTAMNCGGGYYDEDGFFQPIENCNTITTHYSCSNGHTFSIDK